MKYTKFTASAALLTLLFSTFVQCYGNFPLVKFFYDLNGKIGGKLGLSGLGERLVNSILMWFPFSIIYGFATLADVVVFNLIEFWTGKAIRIGNNDTIQKDLDDGSKMEISYIDKGNTMQIKTVDPSGKLELQYVFRNQPGKFFKKIDGEYVEIEMKKRDKDERHFEMVYTIGKDKKTVIVEKERLYAMQFRISRMYELVMKQNSEKTVAAVPSIIQ